MKKIILIIAIVIASFTALYGQGGFIDGNIKIGADIFHVSSSSLDQSTMISIYNHSKNTKDIPSLPVEDIKKLLPIRDEDKHFDVEKEKEIVLKTLYPKVGQLQSKKENLGIKYVFYPDGKIMNIDFFFYDGTVITPGEIAKIDENLRKELKMKFTGEQYKAYPAIYFSKKSIVF